MPLKSIVPSVVELGRDVVVDVGVDESEAVETELLFPLFPVMILSISTPKFMKIWQVRNCIQMVMRTYLDIDKYQHFFLWSS